MSRPKNRKTKPTSVTIEFHQLDVMKSEKLNYSEVVKAALDEYLKIQYPKKYREFKALRDEERRNSSL